MPKIYGTPVIFVFLAASASVKLIVRNCSTTCKGPGAARASVELSSQKD
jgi:hypothetical protein